MQTRMDKTESQKAIQRTILAIQAWDKELISKTRTGRFGKH